MMGRVVRRTRSAGCQQQRRCQCRHAVRSGFLASLLLLLLHLGMASRPSTLGTHKRVAKTVISEPKHKTSSVGTATARRIRVGQHRLGHRCPAAPLLPLLHRGRHAWRLFPIELEALTRFMPKNSRSTGRRQW